eukprot:CAMPEP_0114248118 /NCGR_PEP_ID=MMETSP0058-20121206/13395_1 /TAXON_ID=36894 /ORGANISM="Pyramimonas parkeae, CCMP726" /LENGTH=1017 /DNA_ID=CAMNT_0001361489 /DNA_START=230 /DNA_END=3280 /DNA_ORIENTATION=+
MNPVQSAPKYRHVKANLGDVRNAQEEEFCGNTILTSKYTAWSFLPVNLYEQFSRAANLYFLFIAILQVTPGLSPTHWFTTVFPLMLVLGLNMVKELYDDSGRHASDRRVNTSPTSLLRNPDGAVAKVPWSQVQVGDVVQVFRDEEIPADMVFLSSSHPQSMAYVETANLDGETSLKLKTAYKRTSGCRAMLSDLSAHEGFAEGYLECELPNNHLYIFEANIVVPAEFADSSGEARREALTPDQLLLRGSTLRNVDWVVGMVAFTGKDTKVMMNMVPAPRKVSQLERHMNKLVIGVFAIMLAISAIFMVVHAVFTDNNRWYVSTDDTWPELASDSFAGMVVHFLRYVILLNQMIPISLYVTLEMVKVIQCIFLSCDRQMYCSENDVRFAVRTTTLNEELGQVEYMLTDKTGTLTQNLMSFVQCCVGTRKYGKFPNPPVRAGVDGPHTVCQDETLREMLKRAPDPETPCIEEAHQMYFHILLNNAVLPATVEGKLAYQSVSPEEEALVSAAADMGWRLLERDLERAKVEVNGATKEFPILAVLEFNSTRKRMSVIVRNPDTNEIQLFCKGADNVIMKLLEGADDPMTCEPVDDGEHEGAGAHGVATVHQVVQQAVQGYSSLGLRTLVLAQRVVSEEEYATWALKHHQASTALQNREQALDDVAEEIECKLELTGAVAVDDKLQEGVPDAIASLMKAGIRVWMLTGDKLETAVSIAKSCRLVEADAEILELAATALDDGPAPLDKALEDNKLMNMVIDGHCLRKALEDEVQEKFLNVCKLCKAVVCCRVSPLQKAQVTKLVKEKAGAVTLAIGDGANDVGMIKAAHIGVGVSGREGRQAVLASDYAVGQFRFLTRLLLVHGRWSYLRNKEVVMYAFYKNFAYCMGNVWIAFLSGFSSQPLYSAALIASFNVFWTSFPTIAYAAFEQDVPGNLAHDNPQLYQVTSREKELQFFGDVLGWLTMAIYHSVIIFFGVCFSMSDPSASITSSDGRIGGLWSTGVAVYTVVIIVANLKLAIRTVHW